MEAALGKDAREKIKQCSEIIILDGYCCTAGKKILKSQKLHIACKL